MVPQAGIQCSTCGGSVFLERQTDGPSEWRCQACHREIISEFEMALTAAYLQRRAEGKVGTRPDSQPTLRQKRASA